MISTDLISPQLHDESHLIENSPLASAIFLGESDQTTPPALTSRVKVERSPSRAASKSSSSSFLSSVLSAAGVPKSRENNVETYTIDTE